MASSVAKLFVQIDANAAGFTKAIGEIDSRIAGLGNKMQSVGQNITKAGVGLTAGITLPIVAGVTAATKAAIDWESAFAGVRKTVTATEPELMALSAGIQQLSKTIPVSAVELAGIAEIAGQLGVKTGNILKFTETIAALGVTTNLSAEEAATSLAQFANITGLPQDQIDRLGSTIVALGNNLATTERDIVNMATRLAGAGATVGMADADILSLAGALSSVGIEAESGGSAFSRVLVDMANAAASGGKDLEKFASVAGVSASDFAQEFKATPAKAMLSFIKGLQGIQDAGGNVFATLEDLGLADIRVRDALLRAAGAGDLFSDALALGNQAWIENTALTNEAAQRYGTTASKLEILKNRFREMMVTIGGPLVDALTRALDVAEPFFKMIESGAKAFATADPATQGIILTVLGLTAAIGPALLVLGPIVGFVGTLVGFLATPVGLGIAAVLGAIAAYTVEDFGGLAEVVRLISGLSSEIAGGPQTPMQRFKGFEADFMAQRTDPDQVRAWDANSDITSLRWGEDWRNNSEAVAYFIENMGGYVTESGTQLDQFKAKAAQVRTSWATEWGIVKDDLKTNIDYMIESFESLSATMTAIFGVDGKSGKAGIMTGGFVESIAGTAANIIRFVGDMLNMFDLLGLAFLNIKNNLLSGNISAWIAEGARLDQEFKKLFQGGDYVGGGAFGTGTNTGTNTGISAQSIPTTTGRTIGGGTTVVNNLNSPVVSGVTVDSAERQEALMKRISAELEAAFGLSVDAGTRAGMAAY